MYIENQFSTIKDLIAEEKKKSDPVPFLEDIENAFIEVESVYLQNPKDTFKLTRYAGGLGRIVLEDYEFARTKLGAEIINLVNHFL